MAFSAYSISIGLGLFSHCTFLLGHGYALALVFLLLEGWADKFLLATFPARSPHADQCGSSIQGRGEKGRGRNASGSVRLVARCIVINLRHGERDLKRGPTPATMNPLA